MISALKILEGSYVGNAIGDDCSLAASHRPRNYVYDSRKYSPSVQISKSLIESLRDEAFRKLAESVGAAIGAATERDFLEETFYNEQLGIPYGFREGKTDEDDASRAISCTGRTIRTQPNLQSIPLRSKKSLRDVFRRSPEIPG